MTAALFIGLVAVMAALVFRAVILVIAITTLAITMSSVGGRVIVAVGLPALVGLQVSAQ